ncbi:MAG: TlpA family protein disulfide reductase [Bacteroidaceae bacterium]|nr:TlpA family protein disulfide reductase [Bacteroidaceae bacterium]
MKKFLFVWLAATALSASAQKPVTINFKAHDTSLQEVEIQFAETDTIIPLTLVGDTTTATKHAEGKAVLKVKEPTYGRVVYRWKRTPIYLEPGKDFQMEWDLTPAALSLEVTSKTSQVNPYLNGQLPGPVMGDFGKDPEEIMPILDEYVDQCYKILESKKLDKLFVEKEKKRIAYRIYNFLADYAQQKPCDQPVYDKLEELAGTDEPWLMQMPEYTNFMSSAVTALALRDEDIEEGPAGQAKAVVTVLEYAAKNLKDKSMKEYIIGTNAIALVKNNGSDGAERIKEIFEQNVSDPEIVEAFKTVWTEGSVLVAGRPSPDFTFVDINGKQVSLKDLRGRYVYIDVWATWCVPCRGELPHLKKLEETFKGMNIAFVSLSCDKDKAKWEKMVKDDQMGGIQLWGDADNAFLNAYRVQTIPRFIFLDPEGRIVNPDMTRPSQPETIEALGQVAMPL